MPRPKEETVAEPKRRSRTGCWPCKARKVKCGEEKPCCANCVKTGEPCDYSIRLNWSGRSKKSDGGFIQFDSTPHAGENAFSAQHIAAPASRPSSAHQSSSLPTPSDTPRGEPAGIDPRLQAVGSLSTPTSTLSPFPQSAPLFSHGQQAQLAINPNSESSQHDLPPWSATTSATFEFSWSPQHSAKRIKLSQSPSMPPASSFTRPDALGNPSPGSTHFTPHSISSIVNTPATPSSSLASGSPHANNGGLTVQDSPDLRRLSVKSLLSDDAESSSRPRYSRKNSHDYRVYGYDHGWPDLDVPRNDDSSVIQPQLPDLRRASNAAAESDSGSSDSGRQIAFEKGGYYASPVPIKIPYALEPLPQELLSNPMNLLYFHHFINHTGRILVPHDCSENPLRSVLPSMAVKNIHLLHLLLAFSASHRARLLDHSEPASRIAGWTSDVFPALRQALIEPSSPRTSDPGDPSNLGPLATAIMLASLEIISPNTFAVPITWQNHLQVARQLIMARGGLDYLARKADGARDKSIFFLSRWFAYLDVLGSLSGSKHDQPLFGAYLEDGSGLWLVNRDGEEVFKIDCFFGFSGRCIALLAQVAEMAHECDGQRIDSATNEIRPEWQPSEKTARQARELSKRLCASAKNVYRGCVHSDPSTPQSVERKSQTDIDEIYATNEAYHWAGLIALSRRVLALPSSHPHVQAQVHLILDALMKVRRGSTAEVCLLFPIFSAGCECITDADRQMVMERLKGVEGWGMLHVQRARQLMQRVWDTGRPWETLVNGEFFG